MNSKINHSPIRFAIIVSEFNQEITSKLLEGSVSRLMALGVDKMDMTVIHVPGAIEIPLTAQLLAKLKKYAAIICLGAVIRGETDHYDYVCTQVSEGCQRVMMQFEIPVIFGILTVNNIQQAYERAGGKEGHKGIEAADVAVKMISILRNIL